MVVTSCCGQLGTTHFGCNPISRIQGIRISISVPRSLGSCCIEEADESVDLLLPLMHHDLSYFGSLILIKIALKEGTLRVEEIIGLNRVHDYNHDMFALCNRFVIMKLSTDYNTQKTINFLLNKIVWWHYFLIVVFRY